MDAILKKRRAVKGRLTRIQNVIGDQGDQQIPNRMVNKYKPQLEQLQRELDEIHNELNALCDDDTFEPHQVEYDALTNRIEALQDKFPEDQAAVTAPEQQPPVPAAQPPVPVPAAQPATAANHVRLPRLELPTFSGNFYDWSSFFDLFSATIVKNDQLAGAQKLQYLKSSLRGEAAALLQSLQVTDDNFDEAWELLKGRYHNRREIINAHLKRLCSQPTMNSESPVALRKLIDTTNESVRALKVLKAPVEHWDMILVHLVSERLDVDSRRQWELSLKNTEVVNYVDFIAFLEQRARALMTCTQPRVKSNHRPPERKGPSTSSYHVNTARDTCKICKGKHSSFKCDELRDSSIEDRRDMVRTHNLCFNCLSADHQWKHCKSGGCRKCGSKHHTLLHQNQHATRPSRPSSPESSESKASHHSYNNNNDKPVQPTRVLLATALVGIRDNHGHNQVCRALLDSGSQASFITEGCFQRLGLPRIRSSVVVTGISETAVNVSRGTALLSVTSCVDKNVQLKVDAVILKKVTSNMPDVKYDPTSWAHLPIMKLADPDFYVPNPVDVLFGADVLAEVLQSGLEKGPVNTPIAQNSTLGWLVSGKTQSRSLMTSVMANTAQLDLHSAVQRFWELEEAPNFKPFSEEEKKCELHFLETHQRDSDGRFTVRLPFKDSPIMQDPAESRVIAIRRLKQVERSLAAHPHRQKEYRDFLLEYENLNHMQLMPRDLPLQAESVYLPHHAVIKDSSTTTRLRVVFDASAKGRNCASLNDHLMVGPTVQEDMFSILIRFRTYLIAFTADIQKMYRQIRVHDDDTKFQNIVWRDSVDQPIRDYRLLTLTYGTASAPYLATRCLKQLALDESSDFPEAAAIASTDFYVDDLMTGADTEQDAVRLQADLTSMLGRGGFDLRKFSSNSNAVLLAVPPELRETQPSLNLDVDNTTKTLGLRWTPTTDDFSFNLDIENYGMSDTKRTMLSTLAKIFDPLGWLAPITVRVKILLQQLWRTPCKWDEALPNQISAEWLQFLQELKHVETLRIPRKVCYEGTTDLQLHGYCDASEKAYAAAIYLRVQREDGTVEVNLITAKTRVAPLKFVSLPRLELCGALLLARLMESVRAAFRVPVQELHAWTDSTITLAWINACAVRWKTFVANRVAEIHEKLPAKHWHHVKGTDNPVDCASRGISPAALENHNLWWHGPTSLQNVDIVESTPDLDSTDELVTQEERVVLSSVIRHADPLLSRYSSLNKLTRVTAFLFRFIHNCKVAKAERKQGHLTNDELNMALQHWIKSAQQDEFSQDIRSLNNNGALHAESRIKSLNPFIDGIGVMRVGGRLRNAVTSVDRKFPILLPRKHVLTTLIVRQEHLRNLHAGPQLLLSAIQQRFWIVCGRDVARLFVRNCVICHRQRPAIIRPTMGDLPAARVNPSRPFLHAGVDYAGPFTLRALKLRGQKTFKGYVALFVCFSTRAIHLELVSDMTSISFIAALRRFISRRGLCSDLYSDQGTNFVGANKDLKAFLKFTRQPTHNETVAHHLSDVGINWHFNPPAAPHFGGLWEAGVKSVKHHLRRVVGNVSLTFEEMSTVLAQIEACLNSRPLCPLSSNPDDLSVLTPGHFLIGDSLNALAEPDYTSQKLSRLARWQLVQRLSQHFWKRWSQEYLSRLQQRPKKWTTSSDIKVHDLVLIKDENQPPSKWKLGRVQQTHPGTDGQVRVVTVKTANGDFRRPVVKLCKLPIE